MTLINTEREEARDREARNIARRVENLCAARRSPVTITVVIRADTELRRDRTTDQLNRAINMGLVDFIDAGAGRFYWPASWHFGPRSECSQ